MGIGAATAVGTTAAAIGSAAAAAAPTIGAIGSVAGLAGAATSAIGSIQQGNYSAQVAKNNALIAKQSATYSAQAGEVQAENQSLRNASQLGQLKANQAANNIDTNSGSALQVQEGQEAAGELDTQTTLHNALLQAYGYQTQGTSETAQATQDTTAGYEGASAGLLGSISAIGFRLPSLEGSNSSATSSATPAPNTMPQVGGVY